MLDGSVRQFTIIDTPGLADRNTADENLEILQGIANELRELDQEQVSGVIYFHSIESPKFDAIHKENVRILKAICGEAFYPRVAFVTTRWNRISEAVMPIYVDRHEQFEKVFQDLLPGTPPTFRFYMDGKSHLPLLEHFARLNSPSGDQLQFVQELELYMRQHRKSRAFRETEARKPQIRKSQVKKTTVGKQITKRKIRGGICSFL
jgi:hypothetical protein